MPKMTMQEAAELGLLSPEELNAAGFNPFTPRAGASWTPQLGIRPGLNSSSFFRYPSLFQRPGISSLRFGLGGLGQGLTLSPESPSLGLGGVAAPVGRAGGARGVSYGVAGGVAGGRAGIGSEGSGNLQTMTLPDGRKLVRLPDGRTMIVGGGGRPPVSADSPEGQDTLQAMGFIRGGLGAAQQIARLLPGRGVPGGEAGGVPGGEPGGRPADMPIGAGAGGAPPDALMSPEEQAALGELGINTALPPGFRPGIASIAPGGAPNMAAFGPGTTFEMPGGTGKPGLPNLDPLLTGLQPSVAGDVVQQGSWTGQPEMFPGGILGDNPSGKPGLPADDFSLSPAFYAPGGGSAADVLLDPETRRLYALGLTPEQVMGMMPAPNVSGRADTAPRGLGPEAGDIFGPETDPGAGGGLNLTPSNSLGLIQGLLGGTQGALTGDLGAVIKGLLQSGMPLADILKLPNLNQIGAGAGAGIGALNAIQGLQGGNWQQAIGGGLQGVGGLAKLAQSSPSVLAALGDIGITPDMLATIAPGIGGLGGLLGIAGGVQSLIKGGTQGVASGIPQLAGGALSTYQALQSLFPATFGSAGAGAGAGAGIGAGLASGIAGALPGLLWAGFGQGDPTGGTQAGGAVAGLATTASAIAAGASSLAPLAGAVSGPLAAVAPVIAAIVAYIGAEEEKAARNAGWANNPIKGELYSRATENVARANKILDAIQQTGDLSAVPTADLGRMLPEAVNSMRAYYATAQGPKGAVKASDTITGAGGLTSAKAFMGGQTPAEYTKNAETAKAGIAGLVKELLNRGVTYEQIGQLPVSGDWAQQTLDAGGTPWEFLMERVSPERRAELIQEANGLYGTFAGKSGPMASATGADWRTNTPTNPTEQADALMGLALGSSMIAPAEDSVSATGQKTTGSKASGLMTQMYGGPLWAALARMGAGGPEIQNMIAEHFDPWVNARTPEFIRSWTAPSYTEGDIANYEAQHGSGSAAAAGLQVGGRYGTGGVRLTAEDLVRYEAAQGHPYAGQVGDWIAPTAPAAPATPPVSPTFWDDLAKQQVAPPPADATGGIAFDPLKFLSSLQSGQRTAIQSGADTLTFVPYKPEESAQFTAPDSGYEQVGEGFYARKSPTGGAEIYLPQDRAADLGKTLAGYQGGPPVAGQVASLLTAPVPSGQEAGATPGAGPAGDIAPSPVAAGTAATTEQGTAPNPADATAGTGTPPPGTGFKKGGVVPKTGEYTLHAGELVVPANQTDEILDPAKDMEDEGRINEELQGMRKNGQLNLGGPKPLEMPKPGPYQGSDDPTMPTEAKAPAEKGWYVHLKEGVPSQDLDGTDPMVRRLAFTPDEVERALEAGEAPIMVGKGVLSLPPSALRGMLAKAQDMQFKDPLKNPAVVAMAARFKKQTLKPEGDTLPGSDSPDDIRARVQRRPTPKFPGHRPDQAVPLDSVSNPPDFTRNPDEGRIMDALPKSTPRMPMIPTAPPTPAGIQVNGGSGIARAMMLAQGPQGPAADFARQDRMLEGIDRGTIAPSTLGGASREQRQNLTPQDLMNRQPRPGLLTPQPGLLDRARRLVTG